jgi:hypothetical protein
MIYCWTQVCLLSVQCAVNSIGEERSTRVRGYAGCRKVRAKRLFEYFDYTGKRLERKRSQPLLLVLGGEMW